jgi:hypothetical protein
MNPRIARKIKKVEKFRNGLDIECKKHGSHKKWRLHSENNVQCLFCASEWQMNQRRRNPLKFIFKDARKHSISHKRSFSITLNDLELLINGQDHKCALTGVKFDNDNPPSLDRIDSNIGYELNNIQLILIEVNKMKSNFDQESFIDMCKKIVAYSVKRKSEGKKKKGK